MDAIQGKASAQRLLLLALMERFLPGVSFRGGRRDHRGAPTAPSPAGEAGRGEDRRTVPMLTEHACLPCGRSPVLSLGVRDAGPI